MHEMFCRRSSLLAATMLFALLLTPLARGGVVEIDGKNSATTSQSSLAVDAPGNEIITTASDAQGADLKVQSVTALDDVAGSSWAALMQDSAGSESSAATAQTSTETRRISEAAPAGASPAAVIPLPPAVWTGLFTLGTAGFLALRSRSGRRL